MASVARAKQENMENEVFTPLISMALPITVDCIGDIREIISRARQSVVRHVNLSMTLAYWLIGRRIVVEEQKGKRAAYGEHLLQRLSRELTADFGKGFAEPQLRNCRLFYQAYPSEEAIRYTLCIKLSWSHHRIIMRVGDPKAREFYLQEASERNLSVRDIVREINNHTYERVRAHQVPAEQLGSVTTTQVTPNQILRDPVVAEFLDLRKNLRGKEKKVEKRILDNIESFLLELGKGFSLVGRQVRIPTETSEKYVDFVFYICRPRKNCSLKLSVHEHGRLFISRRIVGICLRIAINDTIRGVMRTVDRYGQMFLKSILLRMKEPGVSQTDLAVRPKVLRPSVSKALHGEVNITFASAVRFAKALQLDFFPQLVQPATGEFYVRPSYQHFSTMGGKPSIVVQWR